MSKYADTEVTGSLLSSGYPIKQIIRAAKEIKVVERTDAGKQDAIPDGWTPVPIEPTQSMVEVISPLLQRPAIRMYRAMIAASPEPTK